ncbi:hypothetical protein K491DRAFT_755344 [Lophiostoma macrostomum CBS 122681]|uniref:Uncharacterized protein n=1 Tax=Lophiostoma macrostomum CBS 122681 TaxID=1314788 RepID=A0A6A6TKX0_9PLEO|nr:hypothetical protein K491DRAFT_755344 [Lophiostoma macrostomum CBS 122681]
MNPSFPSQAHSLDGSAANGAIHNGRQRNFQHLKLDVGGAKAQTDGFDDSANIDPNLLALSVKAIEMSAKKLPNSANGVSDTGNGNQVDLLNSSRLAGEWAEDSSGLLGMKYEPQLDNNSGEAPQYQNPWSVQDFHGNGAYVGYGGQVVTPPMDQGPLSDNFSQAAYVHYPQSMQSPIHSGVFSSDVPPMNLLLEPVRQPFQQLRYEPHPKQFSQYPPQVEHSGREQGAWNATIQDSPPMIPVEEQAAAFGYNVHRPQTMSPSMFNGSPAFGNMTQGFHAAPPIPAQHPLQQPVRQQFLAPPYGIPAGYGAPQCGMMPANQVGSNLHPNVQRLPLLKAEPTNLGQLPKKANHIDGKPKRNRKKPGPGVMMRKYDELIGNVPLWDFEILSPHEINFTLAEIIVLLPKWHHNKSIATRFVNNGCTAPIHRTIVLSHRRISDEMQKVISNGLCPLRNTIGCTYRDSMRERGQNTKEKEAHARWRTQMSKALKADASLTEEAFHQEHPEPEFNPIWRWTHENHETPADWNSKTISVTGWLSDRAAYKKSGRHGFKPTPLPFSHLMKDVAKLPEGPDAGDLTRALEYALNNRKIINGYYGDYMFPNDLDEILDIIGRTEITDEHYDDAAIARWTGIKPACDEGKLPAPRPDKKRKRDSEDDQEAEGEDDSDQAPNATPKPKRARAEEAQAPRAPEGTPIGEDEAPKPGDMSEMAQVVRFAQRADQSHVRWLWDDAHVKEIIRVLTLEWIEKLNARLDESPRPLWRDVETGGDALMEQATRFAKSREQSGINWRADIRHAGLISRTDPEMLEMSLETVTTLVMNFDDCCILWSGEEAWARLFQTATNKYIKQNLPQLATDSPQAMSKEKLPVQNGQATSSLDLGSVARFNAANGNGGVPTGYAPAQARHGP